MTLEWVMSSDTKEVVASEGPHRYAIRGSLGRWSVFYTDSPDAFTALRFVGPVFPGVAEAQDYAERHLADRV